jgi:hypothetical protein
MPATLKTRKPVVKLTTADLNMFPVWEYAIDEEGDAEQDETWVRPVDCEVIRQGEYSQIVASDFTTARGKGLQGFMDITTARGQVDIHAGAIVGEVGYFVLPTLSLDKATALKYGWSLRARDELCQALGLQETGVFPLQYSLRVKVSGENSARGGVIE